MGRGKRVEKLLVVLIALSPFLLLEAGLRIFGYHGPASDPYRGFVGHEPIFLRDGDRMRPDPDRTDLVVHERSFAVEKAPRTVRIICVGDSTTWAWVDGRLVDGYPEKLQETLSRTFPERSFEVINAGVVRFASYRLAGVMNEILKYDPDAVTLLTGSSEFLEARSYREWSERRDREASWLRHWKTLSLLRDLVAGVSGERRGGEDLSERDACLRADFVDERFIVRDLEEIRATLEHSAYNLRMMVEGCRAAGVPLFLLTSPANLRFPPYITRYEDEASRQALEALIRRTEALVKGGRAREAIDLLTPAIATSPRAAGLHYRLGQAWDALGDYERAAEAYIRAKDLDGFPHRTLTRLNEEIRRLAGEPGVFLVDLEKAYSEAVPDGIPDDRLFYDNCHSLPVGHDLICRVLFAALARQGVLRAH